MTQNRPLIAVIEDNADLNGILVHALRAAGYAAEGHLTVEDLEAAEEQPDLYLLDLNLPGEDGLSFARRLRLTRPQAGIVMLTARNEMDQRRRGYDSGADIYLSKPSSVDEILGAIGALSRRLAPAGAPQPDEGQPVLVLSPRRLEITGPGGSVSVTAGEAAVLAHCAADPDGRISLDAFHDAMPDGRDLSKVAIELKIVRLRKKLAGIGFDGRSIGSVRNFGYQLLVPVRIAQT